MVNDVRTELFYDEQWHDISTDVRQNPPITINWGRKNEAAKVSPSSCTLTLDNKDGTYSPRHPLSPLYGKLRRNIPLRVRLGPTDAALLLPGREGARASTPDDASHNITGDLDVRVQVDPESWRPDSFSLVVSDWSTDGVDDGAWALHILADGRVELSWSPDGTLGSRIVEPSTESVSSGAGTVAVWATLDVDNGLGGYTVTYYTAPDIDTPEDDWTQLGDPIETTSGTTSVHASTQPLTIGATGDGGLVFSNGVFYEGRVHAFELRDGVSGTLVASPRFAEPGDTSVTDAQGNTWSLHGTPETAITDESVRFAGEVSSWPPEWDLSGADVRVPIEAAGMRRRLGQGEKPLSSSLRRDLSKRDNVPIYWPMEEGADATTVAAARGGGNLLPSGDVDFGAYTGLAASDALPTFNVGRVRGNVDAYTPDDDQRLMMYIDVPDNGVAAKAQVLEVIMTGSARQWIYSVDDVGNVYLDVYDSEGTSLVSNGPTAADWNGKRLLVWISWEVTGSDVDWTYGELEVGESVGGFTSGTLTGHDVGRVAWVRAGTYTVDLNGAALGHISLLNGDIHGSFWDTAGSSLVAWSGETAGDRIVRLCDEENLPLRVVGDMAATTAMGAQRIDTLLNLLDECAKADMGALVDDRDAVRLLYRARSTLYNQDAAVSLDYSAGEVAATLRPVEDDQLIRNDVTAKRPKGGSHREVLTTGPMSEADVGLYDTAPTVNVASDDQLPDQAGWRLHLGTVDEPRYPTVTGDLTAAPSKVDDATAVFVGDRIQVTNPPSWQPPDTIDQLAQGGTEKLTPYRHTIAYNCSPASPWNAVVVGTTKVDTARSELDTGITDSATSMDVRTTVGEDWTTDNAEFPFDVELGGEIVTVSDIGSAVSSVQTFTISARGVNGITKSHDAGTAVRLAPRHRGHVAMRETA